MAKRLPGHTGNLLAGHDGVDHQVALVDDNGNVAVGGAVASGATDTGNPVKIGGVYNSTKPTLTNGQRGDAQLTTRGMIGVTLFAEDSVQAFGSSSINGDGVSASGIGIVSSTYNRIFNGTTYDRVRSNVDATGLASAARTTTTNSGDITNYNGTGIHVVLDVTNAGTGSITLTIQGKDALSGQYYTLLAGAAVTTVSTNVYKVFPGSTVTANVSANDICPRTIRILVTHNNANSITYSVGYSLIL